MSLQSCPTLWDPMDCSHSGSSVHGILQAKILERVAISSSRGSSRSRDWTRVSGLLSRGFFITSATPWPSPIFKVLLCAVLSPLVTSNSLQPHGLQPARLLCPWGFSRQEYWNGLPSPPPGDLSNPVIEGRSPSLQANSLTYEPPKKSKNTGMGCLSLL